jgi:diketogulonate reductase-like aldo/keto reductase
LSLPGLADVPLDLRERIIAVATVPLITLNNGIKIPQLGLGVWQIPNGTVEGAIEAALAAGYRSIDTAAAYNNEEGVGNAVAAASLPREELFITTKLRNDDQGYDSTLKAFDDSLKRLRLDYVDLYLIHWPLPARGLFVDTWRALEAIQASGRARAIGVSNFRPEDLDKLAETSSVVPAVNQVELHTGFQQAELRAYHAAHGIVTESWSPLGRGASLDNEAIVALAAKYGKTPAQIVLRWHIEIGAIVIPKSSTPARITENIDIFDFELADDDLTTIAGLDTGARIGGDPSVVGS